MGYVPHESASPHALQQHVGVLGTYGDGAGGDGGGVGVGLGVGAGGVGLGVGAGVVLVVWGPVAMSKQVIKVSGARLAGHVSWHRAP